MGREGHVGRVKINLDLGIDLKHEYKGYSLNMCLKQKEALNHMLICRM